MPAATTVEQPPMQQTIEAASSVQDSSSLPDTNPVQDETVQEQEVKAESPAPNSNSEIQKAYRRSVRIGEYMTDGLANLPTKPKRSDFKGTDEEFSETEQAWQKDRQNTVDAIKLEATMKVDTEDWEKTNQMPDKATNPAGYKKWEENYANFILTQREKYRAEKNTTQEPKTPLSNPSATSEVTAPVPDPDTKNQNKQSIVQRLRTLITPKAKGEKPPVQNVDMSQFAAQPTKRKENPNFKLQKT